MASVEYVIKITEVKPVIELVAAGSALDELLSRSYTPEAMSAEYARFHKALEPFKPQESGE